MMNESNQIQKIEGWVCFNGMMLPESEARVPVTDRGFLFGDGLFTSLRVKEGRVEFYNAHLQRLLQQCEQLSIRPPVIEKGWIKELILLNQAQKGTWRLKILITGGEDPLLRLPRREGGCLLITLKPFHVESFAPCRIGFFPAPVERPISPYKTLAYLDRLWIKEYAYAKGFDDMLVFDGKGYLLETAFSNVFWLGKDCFFTPQSSLPYLQGVLIKQLMQHIPLKVEEVQLRREEIPSGSVFFICNSLSHIRPVIEVEGVRVERQEDLEILLKETLDLALKKDCVVFDGCN